MSLLDIAKTVLTIAVEINTANQTDRDRRQDRERIQSLEVGTRRVRARKEGQDLYVRYEEVVEDDFGKDLLVIEGVWEYGKDRHHWFKPSDCGFTKLTEKHMERMLRMLEKEEYINGYTLWTKWSRDQYYNATLWGG